MMIPDAFKLAAVAAPDNGLFFLLRITTTTSVVGLPLLKLDRVLTVPPPHFFFFTSFDHLFFLVNKERTLGIWKGVFFIGFLATI